MNLTDVEATAEEQSGRILDLIEGGRRGELHEFMNGLTRSELAWVVLALAQGLLVQESENGRLHVQNGVLRQQNETLDTANVSLFRERRDLLDRVKELRGILHGRAAVSGLSDVGAKV